MPIVQAYQCPYTKRLFDINDKPRYIKHLKKIARTTYPLKLAKLFSNSFDLVKFKNSVNSIEHFQHLFQMNLHKYIGLVVHTMDDKSFSYNAHDFYQAFKSKSVVNECSFKYSSEDTWIRVSGSKYYTELGAMIELQMFGSKASPYVFSTARELFSLFDMDVSSGGTSHINGPELHYWVKLKAKDWKFVAFHCVHQYVLNHANTDNDWKNDDDWHLYYKELFDVHWPNSFDSLTDNLSTYSSLNAPPESFSLLLDSCLNEKLLNIHDNDIVEINQFVV